MDILPGRLAQSFAEAVPLAFEAAGAATVSPAVASLLATAIAGPRLDEADATEVHRALRRQYGKDTRWNEDSRWFPAVPSLRFDARGLPALTIDCQGFVVAVGSVNPGRNTRSYPTTVVGPLGKPLSLTMPLLFLQALLDDDLERFPIATRDSRHTAWQMPGVKDVVRLPNRFVSGLAQALRRQPVVDWLVGFGPQGRTLAPLVAGALWGMQLQQASGAAGGPLLFSTERLVAALTSLSYRHDEIEQLLQAAAPYLRADMTLEEALKVVLRQTSK